MNGLVWVIKTFTNGEYLGGCGMIGASLVPFLVLEINGILIFIDCSGQWR